MRIFFLIRSLGVGGAERQLAVLASALHARGHSVTVCATYPGGSVADELERSGVPLLNLGKRSRWDAAGLRARLVRAVRAAAPDVLHGYMPTSNLLTLVAGASRETRVVWGVRASWVDWRVYSWMARATFSLSCRLAGRADLIIANSQSGRRYHVEHGYPAERTIVIPNGIDTERFRRDPTGRTRIREEWHVPGEAPLVGLVGRIDPMKDPENFLAAAATVARVHPAARFAVVGQGSAADIDALRARAAALRLGDRLVISPARGDLAAVYSALDVLVSASRFGEGFSNVIGEAMACGVPCAVTDVGDAGSLVGATGRVVPIRQPEALARAVVELLGGDPVLQQSETRARIELGFSVPLLVSRTEAALARVLARRAA